ncbi:hypothetical protein JHK87_018585 [Glycine soja]|nr:hypothetical protein JHK87_018585 [Glycine soja]
MSKSRGSMLNVKERTKQKGEETCAKIPPPGRSSTPKQTDAPASVARSLQNVMADVQGSLNATTLRSESYKTNGFEFQHEAESIASDTERVTSGSSSGEGI